MCIHYITDMSLCNKGKMLDTVILSQHVLSATFKSKMYGQIIMSLSEALKTQCEIKNNVFISAQCPGSEDGRYRHPTSCRHYFECVDMGTENTQVFTRECPRSNRFFNPFFQRCMWLPSGNCNQRGTATTSPPLTCTLPSEGWHVVLFTIYQAMWPRVVFYCGFVVCIQHVDIFIVSSSFVVSMYRKTSSISRTLVGNKIVDNSDVVGASPVGAAPTTSSFST